MRTNVLKITTTIDIMSTTALLRVSIDVCSAAKCRLCAAVNTAACKP